MRITAMNGLNGYMNIITITKTYWHMATYTAIMDFITRLMRIYMTLFMGMIRGLPILPMSTITMATFMAITHTPLEVTIHIT